MLHLSVRGWRRVFAIGISGSELLKKPGPHMGSRITEEQYWFPIVQLFSNCPLRAPFFFFSCLQYVIITHLY